MDKQELQLLIVGAGPCGLACAAAAEKAGLNYLAVDRGCIANSIAGFPGNMKFFSTSDRMSIGQVPFITPEPNPTRQEALAYYRQVVDHLGLAVATYRQVTGIKPHNGGFEVSTVASRGGPREAAAFQQQDGILYKTAALVLATGYFDNPNRLHVPGEDLPHVSHYFTESHPYYGQRVVVVGGRNSAVEAALELYRAGAQVTLVHRGSQLSDRVKPWILPFFQTRVKQGEIDVRFQSQVKSIAPREVTLTGPEGQEQLAADFVFLLTGYVPDHSVLQSLGVTIDPETGRPQWDSHSMETNVPNLYVAGVLAAGYDANQIFIENGRFHGIKIVRHRLVKAGMTPAQAAQLLPLPPDPDTVDDPALVL